ncbi:MAG: hypothetical protein RLZ64_2172, partial [Pseudomonadota bacterium]
MTTPVRTPRDPVKHPGIDQAADPANTPAA